MKARSRQAMVCLFGLFVFANAQRESAPYVLADAQGNAPYGLLCDLKPAPSLAVSEEPRFDWVHPHLSSCDGNEDESPPLINQMHVAWRIQVAFARSGDAFSESLAWDSGMVFSRDDPSPARAITAPPGVLQSSMPYVWRVRVWASAACASLWSSPAKFVVR